MLTANGVRIAWSRVEGTWGHRSNPRAGQWRHAILDFVVDVT